MISAEQAVLEAEQGLQGIYAEIDSVAYKNQRRVLNAFREHRIAPEHFAERTGYGIDDPARGALDAVAADIFQSEAAAIRLQLVSGTHALACALFGNLQPGDRLLCLTGTPYDTLEKVIGRKRHYAGSLVQQGIIYEEIDIIPLLDDENSLSSKIESALSRPCKMAYIQKSCGYSTSRPTLLNDQIRRICRLVKRCNDECVILVDNCYGEFVEDEEPTQAGADLIAGSLIKNPGGGLAISGGYFAGRRQLVEASLNRLTAPGIGGHSGVMFNQNRLLFQGLFQAPSVVQSAVKGAHLFARVFQSFNLPACPDWQVKRGDIIQAIKFGEQRALVNFLKALQRFSPVDSHVQPEAANMPGYEDKVVMAGGTFVEGATIELSADGPLRPPYAAFIQGGLNYAHIRVALSGLLELGDSEEYRFLPG